MRAHVAAVDLGGTKTEVGIVAPDNAIVARRRFATEDWLGADSVADRIADCVDALRQELPAGTKISATGICCPGPLDPVTGMLHDPPNLPSLHYAPMRSLLQERLHMPVRLEHDAKATGLGEFHFGAGRGEESMVYIVVGTGVGAAIISDGELYRGMHNTAGEFGHSTIDLHGMRCHCGSIGCVETFMGGPWLARRYAAARCGIEPSLAVKTELTGEDIANLAAEDDELANNIIKGAGKALGAAIGSLAMVLDIECFVVGGSVAHCGERLLGPARAALADYAYASVARHVRIVRNELDTDGALLGCAWLAREMVDATFQQ